MPHLTKLLKDIKSLGLRQKFESSGDYFFIMLKVGDKVHILGAIGTVTFQGGDANIYYVAWNSNKILKEFNTESLSKYTTEVLEKKYSIKYKHAFAWDSPDFENLEDLSNWVGILNNEILSKQIKILK